MAWKGIFYLLIDKLQDSLYRILKTGWNTGSHRLTQTPSHKNDQCTEEIAKEEGIKMKGPKTGSFVSNRITITDT